MRYLHKVTGKQGFIDLHNHTDYSYSWEMGKMRIDPIGYLEEVNEYAQKYNKPVTFSITDHSNVNANRKILQALKENPKKYENIRYIPGCEYTVYCDSLGVCYDRNGKEKPVLPHNKLHMLAYGMDLEDPTIKYLNTLMSTSKKCVREYVETNDYAKVRPIKFGSIIFATKKWLKDKNMDIEIAEFQDDCQLQPTFDETVDVVEKFLKKRFNLSSKEMASWKKFVNEKDNLMKYINPDVQEVMSIVEKAGGYTVLAHPIYDGPDEEFQHINDPGNKDKRNDKWRNMVFEDTEKTNWNRMSDAELKKNTKAMDKYYDWLYKTLTVNAKNPITGEKLNGIVGHELMHPANQKNQYKFDAIMKMGDKYGLYCTGGSDSHGDLYPYCIPSRLVGAQVQKFETGLNSKTVCYAMTKCSFVDDYFKSLKSGKKLTRDTSRCANDQVKLLRTVNGKEKYLSIQNLRDALHASYVPRSNRSREARANRLRRMNNVVIDEATYA